MRKAIINNSGVNEVSKAMRDAIYKAMDRKKADECVINLIDGNMAEVDLLGCGKILAYGVAVIAKEEV